MPSAETQTVRAQSRRANDPFEHQFDDTVDGEPTSVSSGSPPDHVIPIIAHQPGEMLLDAMAAMREPLRRLVPLMASVLSEFRGLNARVRESDPSDRTFWWLGHRVDDRLGLVVRRVDEMWILFEHVVATMDGLRRKSGVGRRSGGGDGSGDLIPCILHELATPTACVRSQLYVGREDLRALVALGAGFRNGGNPMAWAELQQRLRELESVFSDGVQGAAHVLDVVQSATAVGDGGRNAADVHTVVGRVVRLLGRRARRTAVIETELDHNLFVTATGSEVAQVLVNLVMNAIQAIERTSHQGTIVVRAHRQGGSIVCDVCDDGPGVSGTDAQRIFEPYVSGRRPGVGSGLGLAISRDIARSCGGDIELTSMPGFTTFRLRLPASQAPAIAS